MKLSPPQIALSLVFGFVLTLLGAFWAVQVVRTPPPGDVIDPMRLNLSEFRHLGLEQQADGTYLLRVVAKQWEYDIGQPRDTPALIQIPAGSTVQIVATSMDVIHTLQLPGYPQQSAVPGRISRVFYQFPTPGRFITVCSEYCGPKHHEMTIIINVIATP